MSYKFECPKCGKSDIIEEVRNVIEFNEIYVDDDGEVQYKDSERSDGKIHHYECEACGTVLEGVGDHESLVKYLKNHQRQRKLKKLLT